MEGLLSGIARVDLGVFATPVEARDIGGLRVLVKRDDKIGGNKVRALEFLLARPAKRLLTYSTLGGHHAYATQECGRRLGLDTVAVIVRRGVRGPHCDALENRVEVGGVLGAVWATIRHWRRGTRVIPPGGMSPRGALGYLAAALELEEVPPRIYVPLGTGTTASGLLAGLMLRGAQTEVVAVRVADAVAGMRWLIWRRARKALRLLGKRAERGGVRLRVVKAAGGYGEPTPEALAAVEAAGGLELEPTYTGKTLAVLLAEKADGALFINTYAS